MRVDATRSSCNRSEAAGSHRWELASITPPSGSPDIPRRGACACANQFHCVRMGATRRPGYGAEDKLRRKISAGFGWLMPNIRPPA
jgi:hypothetical protein